MNPLDYLNQQNELIRDINSILKKFRIKERISLQDITITANGVTDGIKQIAKLSDAVTNFLWPSISTETVYHYTSKEVAEKILNSGIFRLTNIGKRYNEGEITTFYITHKLSGYMGTNEDGIPNDKDLVENTYYASFTSTKLTTKQEEYFWTNFASYEGVRLKMEIKAINQNFRKIYYEQTNGKQIPLLMELGNLVADKYKRKFTLKRISTLCAFYLSGADYGKENEYRLLHRVWDNSGLQPKTDEKFSYLELPLNCMTECGYELKVVEVHAKEEINMPTSYVFSKRT
jgi:hypothetical protein